MLAKFRDDFETTSMSSASTTKSSKHQEDETSGDEDSYSVQRIKWLEEYGQNRADGSSSSHTNLQTRYKKAYKSFKNVIKRNTPSTLTNSLASIRTGKKNEQLLDTDVNNNSTLLSMNLNGRHGDDLDASYLGGDLAKKDLIVFQDDYSYDSQNQQKSKSNSSTTQRKNSQNY